MNSRAHKYCLSVSCGAEAALTLKPRVVLQTQLMDILAPVDKPLQTGCPPNPTEEQLIIDFCWVLVESRPGLFFPPDLIASDLNIGDQGRAHPLAPGLHRRIASRRKRSWRPSFPLAIPKNRPLLRFSCRVSRSRPALARQQYRLMATRPAR